MDVTLTKLLSYDVVSQPSYVSTRLVYSQESKQPYRMRKIKKYSQKPVK